MFRLKNSRYNIFVSDYTLKKGRKFINAAYEKVGNPVLPDPVIIRYSLFGRNLQPCGVVRWREAGGVFRQYRASHDVVGSQTRHDLTTKVIKLFEEKHPGITIKPEYSGWDGYMDKLTTQVAGSNAPDIVQMDYAFLTDFARRGALLDLTPYADSKELRTEDHDESMIKAGTIDDKLYAITLGVNAAWRHL